MMEYALNDVRYVVPLADRLLEAVRALGREEWFEESCAAARLNVLEREGPDPDEIWRIAGWGKLRPRGLAYLREIWHWRDKEAERMNRPPFKVIVNEQILALAEDLQLGKEVRLPPRFTNPQRGRFSRLVERARKLPESELPRRRLHQRRQKPPNLDEAVNILKTKRDLAAEELKIDPTLIATRSMLEAIAIDAEAGMAKLMNWQRELMCR
jgi:ribonuclease D